jgi:hypothetical protein
MGSEDVLHPVVNLYCKQKESTDVSEYLLPRVAFSVLPRTDRGDLNLERCLACLIRQSQRAPQMTMCRCY